MKFGDRLPQDAIVVNNFNMRKKKILETSEEDSNLFNFS